MEIPELPNPFSNCRVIGDQIDGEAYRRQLDGVARGHPQYVMSRSDLMLFASCPKRWRNGYKDDDDGTDATDFGSAIDCLALTPDKFNDRFVYQPETQPATKTMKIVREGKADVGDDVPWSPNSAFAKEWKESQEGKIVLDREEIEAAHQALCRDERIVELLKVSKKQVMVVGEYHDKETGIIVPCKTLIDLVPDVASTFGKYLADLKTGRNAAPRAWVKAVFDHNYDAQAAMVMDMYVEATKEDRNTFLHAIQENVKPWQTARRMLSMLFVDVGRGKILSALKRYAQCVSTGDWPDWDDKAEYNGWSECDVEPWMVMNS